jgi:phosphopantothenoylcysteine decarboxylase/phosphopantothenate--cysteine ligase
MVPAPSALAGRRIALGVTGGIAAYKSAELVRLLVKAGATVQVIMTEGAQRFITPMTLQVLSGRAVATELFDPDQESRIGHIRIADEAELLVIAPATANAIAKLACGIADDLLTTIALATRAPLVLAPAMNVNMWQHPQTQENVARLCGRGARVVGPDAGDLACGWVGAGRLVQPAEIVDACVHALGLHPRDLEGVALLVTAGPTHEAIDPVRYLANRSSGKMGFALAAQAAARGARVTLVAGPVALPTPAGVAERLDVTSAAEMRAAVLTREEAAACVVMAAAVADYRAATAATAKLKRGDGGLTLALEQNPDILAELALRRRERGRGPLLVGFAAETGDLERRAGDKLARKGCDLLVGNDVSEPGSGFGTDTNRVTLFAPGAAPRRLPLLSKHEAADRILDAIAPLLR